MGKKKTLKSYAEYRLMENMSDYNFYCKLFKRLLVTMFKWKNLPDGVTGEFIENKLYRNGHIVFCKTNVGIIACDGTLSGMNIYNEPLTFSPITTSTEINKIVSPSSLSNNDFVVVYNDVLKENSVGNVNFFAKRLTNIEKTIECNLENLKRPMVVICSESQLESVKAIIAKKTNGEPYVFVNEGFNDNDIKVLGLDIENSVPDLESTKQNIISEALTFFGINNVPIFKRERLITSEAESNNTQIDLNANTMLSMRKQACLEINKKFDLNIDVELSYNNIEKNVKLLKGGE